MGCGRVPPAGPIGVACYILVHDFCSNLDRFFDMPKLACYMDRIINYWLEVTCFKFYLLFLFYNNFELNELIACIVFLKCYIVSFK